MSKMTRGKRHHGFMKFTLGFEEDKSTVCLRVFEVRDVKLPLKCSVVDPYIKCYLLPDSAKKTKRKTTVLKGSLNPWWDEEMRWRIDRTKVRRARCFILSRGGSPQASLIVFVIWRR
jgi:hypothetical protein